MVTPSDGSDNRLPIFIGWTGCSNAISSLSDLLKVLLVGDGESCSSSSARGVRNSGVSDC